MNKMMQFTIKASLGLVLGLSTAVTTTSAVSYAATNDSQVTALLKVKAPNWSKKTAAQKNKAALAPYQKAITTRISQYEHMYKTNHYTVSNDKQSALAYLSYTYLFSSSYKKLTPSFVESIKTDLIKTGKANGNYTKAAVDYAFGHLSTQVKQAAAYNQQHAYPEFVKYGKTGK